MKVRVRFRVGQSDKRTGKVPDEVDVDKNGKKCGAKVQQKAYNFVYNNCVIANSTRVRKLIIILINSG